LFASLAFLPINEVVQGYADLLNTPEVQAQLGILQEFIDYVEYTWVGILLPNGQGHAPPLYPLGKLYYDTL
jgi:hypothetical protein